MHRSPPLLSLFLLAAGVSALEARADDKQGRVTLAPPPALADAIGNVRRVAAEARFTRRWNETDGLVRLEVENPAATELRIEGVQVTSNLFVVSFPRAIRARGTETLVFRYLARAGTSGDVDLVTLLTNDGLRTIEVHQDREAAFTLDTAQLEWTVGEAKSTKSAVFRATQPGLEPTGVRTFGDAKVRAELRALGAGRFSIDVTPESTDTPQRFAVVVETRPALRGTLPLIQGAIVPRR